MKILIIDNNIDPDCWGAQGLCQLARRPLDTVFVRRAPQEDLPPDPSAFDRIIVSGSKTSAVEDAPWIELLLDFIRRTIDAKIPYLGVCYGHQALVRALSGKQSVRKAKTPEFGWTKIEILENSLLLQGLPSSFYSFSAHFDEVSLLPQGMKRLAQSKDCAIQACQLENLPVYGIQFHPETTAARGHAILSKCKKKKTPKNLLNPNDSQKLFDASIGKTIFENFLRT